MSDAEPGRTATIGTVQIGLARSDRCGMVLSIGDVVTGERISVPVSPFMLFDLWLEGHRLSRGGLEVSGSADLCQTIRHIYSAGA